MDISKLSAYLVENGETASLYSIPNGALGNNTGRSIEFVVPNSGHYADSMYGQIDAQAKETWVSIESSLLNNNNNSVIVRLSPCQGYITSSIDRQNTAQLNLNMLDVVGNILGIDEAQVIGASNGSAIAVDTAAASVSSNTNNVEVTSAVWVDYANDNNINLTASLELMSRGGVSLVGITDTDYKPSSGTGKIVNLAMQRGVSAESYLYETGHSHPSKCAHGTLAYMGIGNSYNFSEHRTYENGREVINPYNSSTINSSNGTYIDGGKLTTGSTTEVINVDYQYVESTINNIVSVINSAQIRTSGNIATDTNGSQTFASADALYNNYANNSKEFLTILSNDCKNIRTIAYYWLELDRQLANYDGLINTPLTEFRDFYSDISAMKNLSLSLVGNGNVRVTLDQLFDACSDNNVIISSLLQDITDTQNIKSQIDSFIGASQGKLEGSSWDTVRVRLTEFSNLCQKKNEYANNLMESMQSAYKRLIDYLQKYDLSEADTSKIGEFETQLKEMQERKASLETTLASLVAENGKTVCYGGYDKNGGCLAFYTINNDALIAACQAQINSCNEVIARLNVVLEGLRGLSSEDSMTASGMVSGSQSGGGMMQMPSGGLSGGTPTTPTPNVTPPLNETPPTSVTPSRPTPIVDNVVQNNNTSTEQEKVEEDIIIDEEDVIEDIEDNTNVEEDKPDNIIVDDTPEPVVKPENKDGNILKAIGVTAAVGGAVGATAYGAKQYMKKKNEDERDDEKNYSDEDYDDLEDFDE